mgnify:CR=1 FL=1
MTVVTIIGAALGVLALARIHRNFFGGWETVGQDGDEKELIPLLHTEQTYVLKTRKNLEVKIREEEVQKVEDVPARNFIREFIGRLKVLNPILVDNKKYYYLSTLLVAALVCFGIMDVFYTWAHPRVFGITIWGELIAQGLLWYSVWTALNQKRKYAPAVRDAMLELSITKGVSISLSKRDKEITFRFLKKERTNER